MALGKNMMQGGLSAGQVSAINGQVASSLTAAGTNQATALDITADINFFTTVASGTGCQLYAAMPGDSQIIYNDGANALTVYPPASAQINSVGTNNGVLVGTNTFCEFHCVSATQWVADLSA